MKPSSALDSMMTSYESNDELRMTLLPTHFDQLCLPFLFHISQISFLGYLFFSWVVSQVIGGIGKKGWMEG